MIYDVEQGTAEWAAIRCGKVTGSRIADLMAKTKSGESAIRARYMGELIAERLTGTPTPHYRSKDMENGNEREPEARALYEWRTDLVPIKVGFVDHPTIPMSGASPDGFVGDDGGVEIKCPIIATHIATLLGKSVPGNYVKQIQWNMASSGRAWWDYVSFNPDMPESMRFFCQRVHRDAAMIVEMEREVVRFLSELDATLEALTKAYAA